MNNTVKVVVGLVVVVIIIILAMTLGKGGEETIKIGYVGPLSGDAASIGESSLGGALLAVKEINEKGGVLGKKLELVAEDDKCSSASVAGITKLIEIDNVVAISGPDCSAAGKPAAPIAQSSGVPYVGRWASAPGLTAIGDYIFRVYPSDAFQGSFVADYIKNTLGKTKVAVLYVKDPWGQGVSDVFVEKFKAMGGEIVFLEGVMTESRDLRTQLQQIKKSGAEVLFAPIQVANGVAGLTQAKEIGLNIPIIGGDIFDAEEVRSVPAAKGVMYSLGIVQNPNDFQARVKAETGKNGSIVTAPLAYDTIMVIADAIKRAGSVDREAIRNALPATSYAGVSSALIEFDEARELKNPSFEIKTIE